MLLAMLLLQKIGLSLTSFKRTHFWVVCNTIDCLFCASLPLIFRGAPYNSTRMHGQQYQSTGQNLTKRVTISWSKSFRFTLQLSVFPAMIQKNERNNVIPENIARRRWDRLVKFKSNYYEDIFSVQNKRVVLSREHTRVVNNLFGFPGLSTPSVIQETRCLSPRIQQIDMHAIDFLHVFETSITIQNKVLFVARIWLYGSFCLENEEW